MAKKKDIPWQEIRREYESCRANGSLWTIASLARSFGVNRSHLSRKANDKSQSGGKWQLGRYASEIQELANERSLDDSERTLSDDTNAQSKTSDDNELCDDNQHLPYSGDSKIISISKSVRNNINEKADQLAGIKSEYLKYTETLRKLTMLEISKMVPKKSRAEIIESGLSIEKFAELARTGQADWKNLKNLETAVKIIEKCRGIDWKILAPEENNEVELPESIKRIF